jgi:hypothetical protein
MWDPSLLSTTCVSIIAAAWKHEAGIDTSLQNSINQVEISFSNATLLNGKSWFNRHNSHLNFSSCLNTCNFKSEASGIEEGFANVVSTTVRLLQMQYAICSLCWIIALYITHLMFCFWLLSPCSHVVHYPC